MTALSSPPRRNGALPSALGSGGSPARPARGGVAPAGLPRPGPSRPGAVGGGPRLGGLAPARASRGREVNLASLDLNLLVSLEMLLEHRNVTHAAQRVGLSQPAMSRSLSRLRGMFNDELLVRSSAGLVHTTRGKELHAQLPAALDRIRTLMTARPEGAERWSAPARIAMADHQAFVLLPPLLGRLAAEDALVEVVTEPLAHAFERLEAGELDFAVGQVGFGGPGFFQRQLCSEPYSCLLRRDHPALREAWTADSFFAQRHAVVGTGREAERVFDPLDRLLPERERTVMPNIMSTPMIVAETDLVLTLPHRAAVKAAAMLPLAVVALPVEVPPYETMLLWHERSHREPEHAWMRGAIVAATAAVRTEG